jgi:hypothetical protein
MYVFVCVCIYIYIYIYIYTHEYQNKEALHGCIHMCVYIHQYQHKEAFPKAPEACLHIHTAIPRIIEGHKTAFNGLQYQFTTGKPLKNLKLTFNYYGNSSTIHIHLKILWGCPLFK